nr:MAG TPA: hypothetical protein [Caudoviricetes sp.]
MIFVLIKFFNSVSLALTVFIAFPLYIKNYLDCKVIFRDKKALVLRRANLRNQFYRLHKF